MTYQEIKDKKQTDYNELFNSLGVFWAFSNKQFDEGFEKVKSTMAEGEKLVSIGGGGYIPKHNVEALIAGAKAIDETFKQQIKDAKARETHILYELNNHEAYYTGTIDTTLDALGDDYTAEEVQAVYKKFRAEKYREETKADKYTDATAQKVISNHK